MKMSSENLVRDINTSIVRWYPFKPDSSCIYIGEEDAVFSWLNERFKGGAVRVSAKELSESQDVFGKKADYIISIATPESLENPVDLFRWARVHLFPKGSLLLGLNNRLGIKYFCGDRDYYTDRNFDGIEDYYRAYRSPDDTFMGRCYDKSQIINMLKEAGFDRHKFYSVFSDLNNATFLFADGYIPNEELQIRIFPTYNSPSTIFLEEERLYSSLVENGLFHRMANAFFVECALDGSFSDALQVTSSLDRGHKDALITIIHDNDTVTKQAPFPEGEEKLKALDNNIKYLSSRNVPVVSGILNDGVYIMPLIKAETGMVYLQRLLWNNKELFLKKLDEFKDEIMKASDTFEGEYAFPDLPDEMPEQKQKRPQKLKESWETQEYLLQKRAMVDMIPLNTFYVDGKFVFYDQEFCIENYPLKAVLFRMIVSVYYSSIAEQKIIPRAELFGRYGIDVNDINSFNYLGRIANEWLFQVRNEDKLKQYYKNVRKNFETVNANRQRMNFSGDDYQRLFIDIFENADSRKLILFGSGVFARRFLALYGNDYEVYSIVDNNENRWGSYLYPEGYEPERADVFTDEKRLCIGIEITSPKIFDGLKHGEFKVIICIKNYISVMNQLENMGITEYSIFDPSKAYPRKRHPLTADSAVRLGNSSVAEEKGKKYHIGYIAGVFDLYHIGHLNMFRRAKDMCDYLIVGIVTDEGVRHLKRTDPFVPFVERVEMVKSCRYVDEVVEIPYLYGTTEYAWQMHHFDVQFSGTDYLNDPEFERYKEFLESHGATLEFFPYTESTSSTKIKELIKKKLL